MIKAIPKEIAEKMEQTNQLISEVETWLNENIDLDHGDEHFVDLDNGGNSLSQISQRANFRAMVGGLTLINKVKTGTLEPHIFLWKTVGTLSSALTINH